MSFRVQTSQLAFSENHQQLGNSADRILFPKISVCGLNVQIIIRTDQSDQCISSRRYAFKKL